MKSKLLGALQNSRYGAVELKLYYQRSMSHSLVLSVALHIAFFVALLSTYQTDGSISKSVCHPPVPYGKLPQTSIFLKNPSSTRPSGGTRLLAADLAFPIPVPDIFADPERTLHTQNQGGADSGTSDEWTFENSGSITVEKPVLEEVEPPRFVPREKDPEIVKQVEPKYPELAVKAGIEGTVLLNVWVDKQGRVRKVNVVKSTEEILNTSAIEAAYRWVFTPAVMQKGPVSVWVSIPFRFKLKTN